MNRTELFFPEAATEDERSVKWQKITEVSDADFGFDTPKEKTGNNRFCVRVVLTNDEGKICVIKSEKYGYTQIPGGGIDEGESIIDALRRETREETGFLIDGIKPLGYVLEKREDVRNEYDWDHIVSFVFCAAAGKNVGTDYTEGEAAEGFEPVWVGLEDFMDEKERNDRGIIDYSVCFSDRRDLGIVKYYRDTVLE